MRFQTTTARSCLAWLVLVQAAFAATPNDWRTRAIYQLLTDRFALSTDNSAPCNTTARQYCGGTWQGIVRHLDYIQELGFDAIWISPVVANVEGQTAYGEAYHGYWTEDINSLNAHFGSEKDLVQLSDELHKRGMYLMVDVVINHFASIPSQQPDSSERAFNFSMVSPFSSQSNFHPRCEIKDYNNQTEVEQCWIGDGLMPLADLNTEDPSVVKTMNDWVQSLVQKYKVDGLRIDTAKHIRKDFWPDFLKSAGVFSIGEVVSDDTDYVKGYTEVLDGILDYPTWFKVVDAFSSPAGDLSAMVNAVKKAQQSYKNGLFMTGSFLENHDQPRFQSKTEDLSLVLNAMMWSFVTDGIPILYYGQEQGYTGAADPDNREALWPTAYDMQTRLASHVKVLNAARRAAITSNEKFSTTPMSFISQSDNATLAVSKPPLLALFTNVGTSSARTLHWSIPRYAGVYDGGETIVNVLNCRGHLVGSEGAIDIPVENGVPQLLMPSSSLAKQGSICPGFENLGSNLNSSVNQFRWGSWTTAIISITILQLLYLTFD